MKLKALIDVKIRFEDWIKRDVKKWDIVEVWYMDTVNFFCQRGFAKIENKDMWDTLNTKNNIADKKEAIKQATKKASK